jgi:hypothetical protein
MHTSKGGSPLELSSRKVAEPDLKTPVGRIRQLGSIDKGRELIARTPTTLDLAARQAIEHAITQGAVGSIST